MAPRKRVGFVGLGAMGLPMARRLLAAGFEVRACAHRNRAPLEALVAEGALGAADPAKLAGWADAVVTMVPDAPQVDEVCFGPRGLLAGHPAGKPLTVIDMSTIAPAASIAIAERLAEAGVAFLDAPVSGGPARATTGELAIMVGGAAAVLDAHRDVLEALGRRVVHMGPVGQGEVAKLANNMIIGALMPALAEALTFAVKSGADLAKLREVILASSGANFLLEHWTTDKLLVDRYEGGFALELMLKDLTAALGAAREAGVPAPQVALAHQQYVQAKGLGYGREDYSAVGKLTQDAANVTIATGAPRRGLTS